MCYIIYSVISNQSCKDTYFFPTDNRTFCLSNQGQAHKQKQNPQAISTAKQASLTKLHEKKKPATHQGVTGIINYCNYHLFIRKITTDFAALIFIPSKTFGIAV